MYRLDHGDLAVELCAPGEYYRGTRFDRAGVCRSITKAGHVIADEWFACYDPLKHDAVCGMSEEFYGTVGFDSAPVGGTFLKIGVGLLRRPDDAPYDWFRLYEIADPGEWSVEVSPTSAVYVHRLAGYYAYTKKVELTSPCAIVVSHRLQWLAPEPLEIFSYCHNFFTFGGVPVGPSREIDFPFTPCGHWRSAYDNVGLVERGIRFCGPVDPACSVYMGDLASTDGRTPYSFRIAEQSSGESVSVRGDVPLHHIVFWSNPRVACVEPYVQLRLQPGEMAEWSFTADIDLR